MLYRLNLYDLKVVSATKFMCLKFYFYVCLSVFSATKTGELDYLVKLYIQLID